jgi:acyl-CoA thioesterase FadM
VLGYLSRTLPAVIRATLGRDGQRISRIQRRVRLREIDTNRHMNQAAYAVVMELGRVDLVIRSGAWAKWRASGALPVVAEQRIVYRRELRLGAPYAVETRAISVEGRLLELQSHVLVGADIYAMGEVKLIFIGRGGVLSPAEVDELCADLLIAPLRTANWRVDPKPDPHGEDGGKMHG